MDSNICKFCCCAASRRSGGSLAHLGRLGGPAARRRPRGSAGPRRGAAEACLPRLRMRAWGGASHWHFFPHAPPLLKSVFFELPYVLASI